MYSYQLIITSVYQNNTSNFMPRMSSSMQSFPESRFKWRIFRARSPPQRFVHVRACVYVYVCVCIYVCVCLYVAFSQSHHHPLQLREDRLNKEIALLTQQKDAFIKELDEKATDLFSMRKTLTNQVRTLLHTHTRALSHTLTHAYLTTPFQHCRPLSCSSLWK